LIHASSSQDTQAFPLIFALKAHKAFSALKVSIHVKFCIFLIQNLSFPSMKLSFIQVESCLFQTAVFDYYLVLFLLPTSSSTDHSQFIILRALKAMLLFA